MSLRFALTLALSSTVCSAASAQEPARTIVVTTGTASIGLRPTSARVQLTIDNRSQSAATAASENANRQRRVLAALQRIGFTPQQARVTGYSVRADVDYETSKLRAYEASADVSVAVETIERIGILIDSALAAGATEVSRVAYSSDSASVARNRVLKDALAAARNDAEALAAAAGGRLGRLLDVSTLPLAQGAAGLLALQPGLVSPSGFQTIGPRDVIVEQTVYARWEITY